MNDVEQAVRGHLNELAGGVDVEGERRVSERVTSVTRRQRRRSAAIAMVTGMAVTAAVLAVMGSGIKNSDGDTGSPVARSDVPGHAPLGAGSDYIPLVEELGDRCPGAVEAASPSELQAQAQLEAVVSAPRVGELIGAWSCGSDGVLMYGNGVQVSFTTGWAKVDAAAKWERQIHESGGRVETMDGGRLAYVGPAEGAATRHVVAIVNGDTGIHLLAEKNVPIETLVEMARSMELSRTGR